MKTDTLIRYLIVAVSAALAVGGIVGCSNKTAPTGRVVIEDNSPLPESFTKAQAKNQKKPGAKSAAPKPGQPTGKPVAGTQKK